VTHCCPFQKCPLGQDVEAALLVVVDVVVLVDVETAEQTYLVKSKVDP
jgi:hypothetical protein